MSIPQQRSPLDQAADLIRTRFASRQNTHEKGHYVSVSQLVKHTTTELARKFIEDDWDSGDPFYGFTGNTMADGALADFPCREVKVELSLGNLAMEPGTYNEWTLRGHADAFTSIGNDVICIEAKFWQDAPPEKVELARRQAILYLSMAERMAEQVNEGWDGAFEHAGYASGIQTFGWPENGQALGIILVIFGAYPPPRIITEVVPAEQRKAILDYYLAKARAVAMSVEANDLKAAEEFDAGPGSTEFSRAIQFVPDPPRKVLDFAADYRKTLDAIADLEKVREAMRAEIERAMLHEGLTETVVDGLKVSLRTRNGRETADIDGLRKAELGQFIKSGKPYTVLDVRKVRGVSNDD